MSLSIKVNFQNILLCLHLMCLLYVVLVLPWSDDVNNFSGNIYSSIINIYNHIACKMGTGAV